MEDQTTAPVAHVHLPWGFIPVGDRVRACCSCGYRTTPRANEDRALEALLNKHGCTQPICALCGKDHHGHSWTDLRDRYVEILADDATGGTFLVCRGNPRSCREGADQRQLHLDRAVADGIGFELPTRLRVVRDLP